MAENQGKTFQLSDTTKYETVLDENELKKSDPNCLKVLGDWSTDEENVKRLHDSFVNADPFPHVIIDNFFRPEVAEKLLGSFPELDSDVWFRYDNPIEKKLACNNLDKLDPFVRHLFVDINRPEFVDLIKKITGIPNLESDPFLHGGGLHAHPPGGKLDMHLDYSIHPVSGKERRVNLIVYLNKDWKPEYRGDIQLWDGEMKECRVKVTSLFNRAVLFRTSDVSYHGLPDKVKCPEGQARRSFAVYYVSEPRKDATIRSKACFVARPTDVPSEFMDKLRAIRPTRRLEPEDLVGWEEEEQRIKKIKKERKQQQQQ